MPRVFISYRRSDTEMAAGRLREAIAQRFGNQQTFRDKEDISAGLDWLNEIQHAIGSDAVVLALIGPAWLTARDSEGRRRLDSPDDANRVELEAALSKQLRVVPVLVQGASMPDASELPDALRPLARRHALKLRDDDWNSDVQRIYSALEHAGLVAIGSTPSTSTHDATGQVLEPPRKWKTPAVLIAGVGVLALVAAVGVVIVSQRDGNLCETLSAQTIDLLANGYEGVIGAEGIALQETLPGLYRFQSTVTFIGAGMIDSVAGTCEGAHMEFVRTLRDKQKGTPEASPPKTAQR